jgi:hypothetical protein
MVETEGIIQIEQDNLNNIILIEKETEKNQCNICFGEYNYVKNILCECIYYYHINCFMDWVSSNSAKCIMCSKSVIVNPLIDNNYLEYLNINFDPFIDKPLISSVSKQVYKYNYSLNRKRIENYIFNIDVDLLNVNPIDLMVLINNNVNIPSKKNFRYSWNVKINNKVYFIILSYVLDFGMIYTVKDLSNQKVKTNYVNGYNYPGIVNELFYEKVFENKLDNILISSSNNSVISSNNHFSEEKDSENEYRYNFIFDLDDNNYRSFPIFRKIVSIVLTVLLIMILFVYIVSFRNNN